VWGRRVSGFAEETSALPSRTPSRVVVICALGVTQIFAWGASYYLPAVLAAPIALDTGWSLSWVVGGLSLGLLIAGLVSPQVGGAIALLGGRPVLAASAGLLATGLVALALARSLPVYMLAWLVIGLGMGAGLYDPAFATLGRLYGRRGRSAITALTLFGGLASTICWPLSAFLNAQLGWRGACLIYAGFQLCVALPIYFFLLPRESRQPETATAYPPPPVLATAQQEGPRRGLLPLLATTITLASVISTTLSVHLLSILQAEGFPLAAAVGLGAIVGPSQVAARTIEMLIARFHHPIWTKLASVSLVAAGLAALWIGGPIVALALVLYGAGIGLESIARGTLPLALFGPDRYPVVMGRIAMPSLVAQAAAPSIGAALLQTGGPDGALRIFVGAAICNVLLAASLFPMLPKRAPPFLA
jgi:MFS family permease